MMKSLRLLSFAALLTTGTAAMQHGGDRRQSANRLAASNRICRLTGSAAPATNQRMTQRLGLPALSAQTPGNRQQNTRVSSGPTGSTQSDATNPNRTAPGSGGGGSSGH